MSAHGVKVLVSAPLSPLLPLMRPPATHVAEVRWQWGVCGGWVPLAPLAGPCAPLAAGVVVAGGGLGGLPRVAGIARSPRPRFTEAS